MLWLLFFAADFCAATTRGQLQFEGGVYFLGNPANINDGWIRCIWVIEWQLLDAVSCKRSLSVLLSAMETSHTTQTALMLAWLQSWKYLHMCACAMYTSISHGYIWKVAFLLLKTPDCVATIWGQWLLKGRSIQRNMVFRIYRSDRVTDRQTELIALSCFMHMHTQYNKKAGNKTRINSLL